MPFSRPTLPDIINRTRDDIVSRLPSPEILRRSDAEVYARALAGAAHGLYANLEWLARQVIYDTADDDILLRWADIWQITRKPASQAIGTVVFTGSGGASVLAGTTLVAYDGQLYITDVDVTITGGSVTASITALSEGLAGNRPSGQTLTLQSPVSGVAANAVASALTGGADIESFDSLRARLLARLGTPPQGGSKADYEAWALEVPGVTRAWVTPQELGVGTVTVRFMMDGTYSNGIPLIGDVQAVSDHIFALRPVTAQVSVFAPVAVPLNFTITGLTPIGASIQAAVVAELTDFVKREAEPGGTIFISRINEAISLANGEFDHSLTVPAANVVSPVGSISTMGTVTFV